MGYEAFEKKSQAQLAKHIRTVAKNTGSVIITTHASARMREKKVSSLEVYECLQNGTIGQEPEPNEAKGRLECRMERYVAGRQLAVVAAISDEYPDVVVVTVFKVN